MFEERLKDGIKVAPTSGISISDRTIDNS